MGCIFSFCPSLPGQLTVHDIERRHQVIPHYSEAGDGGEAQRHQH